MDWTLNVIAWMFFFTVYLKTVGYGDGHLRALTPYISLFSCLVGPFHPHYMFYKFYKFYKSKNDISKLTPSPKTCCSENSGDLKAENGLSNLNSSPENSEPENPDETTDDLRAKAHMQVTTKPTSTPISRTNVTKIDNDISDETYAKKLKSPKKITRLQKQNTQKVNSMTNLKPKISPSTFLKTPEANNKTSKGEYKTVNRKNNINK